MQEHTTFSPETLRQVLDAYVQNCRSSKLKPNTIRTYKHTITRLIEWLEGQAVTQIEEVTAAHLREYFIELSEEHNVGGVEVYHRPIRAMFKWYWDEYEMETRNPIDRVKVKHARPEPRPGIPLEHVQALLDACSGENQLRDRAMILGLLDSACRVTEFCNIKMKDVDFRNGRVRIKGKGDKHRTVRFSRRTMRALRRYLRTRGPISPNAPLIASTFDGGHFTRFGIRNTIDRIADRAGIPHYGMHDFRRRAAYELWKNTRDIKSTSQYLGHATVQVTERYVATDDDDIMDAHEQGSPVDNM